MGLSALLAEVPLRSTDLVLLIVGLVLGAGIAYGLLRLFASQQLTAAKQKANQVIDEAKSQAEVIREKGKIDVEKERIAKSKEFERQSAQIKEELKEEKRRL